MKINKTKSIQYVKSFDFSTLFREELGWDNCTLRPLEIPCEGKMFRLEAIQQKSGFVAFQCNQIPDGKQRKIIDREVTKSYRQHFIIYADQKNGRQVWHWVRREQGKPIANRECEFRCSQSGDRLLQKLEMLAVSIDEESQDAVDHIEMGRRTRAAFDVEKVTKKFFDRFKTEHANFMQFIKGIKTETDLQWYASVMLNRLMFVYFIQKKGFLDSDVDYLRNRLALLKSQKGKNKFHSFYRYFLLRLFHDGLGKALKDRDSELEQLLGSIPFLNGGFFELHEIEIRNEKIEIPDEAFEKLFGFFDQYSWHLDERPLRNDNEINPDVVGYIFEKFINQKQMGAYYTKEDITEYIGKNTIIPFLFDAAQKECEIAFQKDSAIWRLLSDNPDRYIYDAVKQGVIAPNNGEVMSIPPALAEGISDIAKRSGWNSPASDNFGLPTETWREYVARRQRCLEIRTKLASGEIHTINELITLNLDIWQFARDVISDCEGPELLRAFWQAIQNVTVLDPTCGSGAFLFAALRILETLYDDVLARMQLFIDLPSQKTPSKKGQEHFQDFKTILAQIEGHPNEKYFVLKSIILNNLYGVDIMDEAVEICKLRLFLKLVAQVERVEQIEPLPDIDFNIRCGNTLIGFTSMQQIRDSQKNKLAFDDEITLIEQEVEGVDKAFQHFRDMQTGKSGTVSSGEKAALRKSLDRLGDKLDCFLASEYGVDAEKSRKALTAWQTSHQPFHWFAQFYGIMNKGGFDVVIGNPPYLELREVDYVPRGYTTLDSGAIHAICIERAVEILRNCGTLSMIVPLALVSTQRMVSVQSILETNRNTWYANFAWRPGKLFEAVNRALTIFVATPSANPMTFSTGYQKWSSEARSEVIPTMMYCQAFRMRPAFWIPKLSVNLDESVLKKLLSISTRMCDYVSRSSANKIYYRTTGGLYWKVFTDFAPKFICNGIPGHSSRETTLSIQEEKFFRPAIAILSSNLFWWWYTITSNLRDLNPSDIQGFPVPNDAMKDKKLGRLCVDYIESLKQNSTMLERNQKQTGKTQTQCFKIQNSKSIIDEIDRVLAIHYGFSLEELDYILNYDIKYRMGVVEEE